jgi:hypothetical protein
MLWNVYAESINAQKIIVYNLFDHGGFWSCCCKALKKYGDSKEDFLNEIKDSLIYCFWSRSEWEVIISEWPPRDHGKPVEIKIDVSDQVINNWHIFSEYVWNNRKEFK